MKQMQPHRRSDRRRMAARRERESSNLQAACRIGVDRKVNNQCMLQAFADFRLLSRQVAAQSMAIRMALARCMRAMPVGSAIVVAATISPVQRRMRRFARDRLVRIMPATSKHRMDEQGRTQ